MSKTITKLLFLMAGLLALMPATAMGQVLVEGIYYQLGSDNTATVSSAPEGTDFAYGGLVEIPSSITCDGVTYQVTAIANAFQDCETLTGVKVPDTVRSIEMNAFCNCTSLTEVDLGNGVETIGMGAFWYCSALEQIRIPDSVTSLGGKAFTGCDALRSVEIGKNVSFKPNADRVVNPFVEAAGLEHLTISPENTYIKEIDGVVYDYEGETLLFLLGKCKSDISVPEGVNSIAYFAFSDNNAVEHVTLPSTLTRIYDQAFKNCKSLKSVVLPQSLKEIPYQCFLYCDNLEDVNFDYIETIGEDSFGCTGLGNVKFSSNLKKIRSYAFVSCKKMTQAVVPASVETVGINPWCGAALTSIEVESGNQKYIIVDGNLVDGESMAMICYPCNRPGESYTIPAEIKSVRSNTFYDVVQLKEMTYNSNITKVADMGFGYGLPAIETLNLNTELTDLDKVSILNKSTLKRINVNEGNKVISSRDGMLLSADGATLYVYPQAKTFDSDLLTGISTFASGSLNRHPSMYTLKMPAGSEIEGSSLNSSRLTSVYLPAKVQIGYLYSDSLEGVYQDDANPEQLQCAWSGYSGAGSMPVLYVPTGCKSKYEAFDGWADMYREIREIDMSNLFTIEPALSWSQDLSGAKVGDMIPIEGLTTENTLSRLIFEVDNQRVCAVTDHPEWFVEDWNEPATRSDGDTQYYIYVYGEGCCNVSVVVPGAEKYATVRLTKRISTDGSGDEDDPSDGVGAVEADPVRVWTEQGVLRCDQLPADARIEVFTIDGTLVYAGAPGIVSVPRGVLLVVRVSLPGSTNVFKLISL